MADYADDITGAAEAIQEDGELVQWFKPSEVGELAKPWEDDPDPVNPEGVDVYIVFLPINRVGFEGLAAIVGTEVPQGRSQGLMAGNVPFEPALNDWVVRGDGTRLGVFNVDPVNPAGDPILYTIIFQEE